MADKFWENLLGGGAAAAGAWDQYQRLIGLGEGVNTDLSALGGQLSDASQFQPYSVTSNLGGLSVGGDGSTAFTLNDFMQQYQDAFMGGSKGAMANATGDITQMQGNIYEQLRAAQRPEEERQRLALEERLLSQGRLGVGTSAFGGTPEALALEKAIGESKNSAFANAFNQAQQYQQNQLATALGLGKGAFLPMSVLMDQAGVGANNAQLAQAGQLGGVGMLGQLGLGGAQIQANMEKIANEMLGGMWQNLAGVAGGIGSKVDDVGWGGLWDSIFG